jgi:hypothetical protein
MLDVIDAAGLLQRTQFAMPVADNDARTVRYAHPLRLLTDLRGMGETAAFANRTNPALTRGILMRAMDIYAQRFSDPDGRVRATFEFVTLSGWAPWSRSTQGKTTRQRKRAPCRCSGCEGTESWREDRALLASRVDLVLEVHESAVRRLAQGADAANDGNADDGCDQAVFDRGCAGTITKKSEERLSSFSCAARFRPIDESLEQGQISLRRGIAPDLRG